MDPVAQLYAEHEKQEVKKTLEKEPRTRFYASSAGYCTRRLVHAHRGDRPAPFSTQGEMITGVGDHLHDKVRVLLRDAGVELGALEFRDDGTVEETDAIRKKFTRGDTTVELSVRSDGRIHIPEMIKLYHPESKDDGWAGLEIKSLDSYSHDKWLPKAFMEEGMEGAIAWIRRVKISHYEQMQLTMGLTGLDTTLYLPVERGFGTIGLRVPEILAGIIVPFDPNMFERLLNKAFIVQKHVDEGTLPPPDHPSPSEKECKKMCDFKHLCHDAFARDGEPVYPWKDEDNGAE